MIYLDHCATTPVDPRVREAMAQARERAAGNPSSVHGPGRKARAALNEARARIAERLGASPAEIVFTASGSEANNLALKGMALRHHPKPFHLVLAAFEHDCALNAARYLAQRLQGVRLTEVAPDKHGLMDPDAIGRACEDGATLVSVMAVNNEIGSRQPVEEIAKIAHRHGALFHTDAVQAAGRFEIDARAIDCDLMSICSHKIYGPRGAGLLYVREGVGLDSMIHGGHQEKGRRAGTENVEAIVGFASALMMAHDRMEDDRIHLGQVESAFLSRLTELEIPFQINGAPDQKVPGIVNLSVPGIESDDLVVGMDLAGFAISAGSACSSGVIEPSHVLNSMGIEPWRVAGAVRISFGRGNSIEDARSAAHAFAGLCANLRTEQSQTIENPR